MKPSRCLTFIFALSCLFANPLAAVEGVFDSNGVSIRYVSEGEGEAVVLLHGWMSDSSMWGRDAAGNTKLDTTRAGGFRFIALDLRGHGKSAKLYEPAWYGAEMAADVVRLLDHLKIEKAHLVGYSMGAFVAGKVAATHPERVLSLFYGGQAPLIVGEPSSGPSEVEIFATAVANGDLGPYILAFTPAGRPKPTPEAATAMGKFYFGGKDLRAFAAAGRGFAGLAVTVEELRRCPAPVLFLHGGNESEAVKNRVAAVRELLGRGELKILAGADHLTTLAHPEFGASLLAFLRAGRVE